VKLLFFAVQGILGVELALAWNLRGYSSYQDWVEARNRRIIDFLRVGRRFKLDEFKIAVYFEQFLTQKTWKWSSFVENFVSRLLEELGKRGYLKKSTCVSLGDRAKISDEIEGEAQTPKREPVEFYVEYEVKAAPTLQALESIIYEITPYLDPAAF